MALAVTGSSPNLSRAGQVFWVGTDGNVWLHNADGSATNMGAANGTATTANLVLNGAKQIDIPAASGGSTTTTAPSNPTGTSSPALDQGSVNATQASIDQIAPLLSAALASENTNYGNTEGTLAASQAAQQGQYDASTTTNQQNYDSNFMDSIRSGIKGLGSLVGLLRGSGASGGTAEDQVRDVVGGQTASDIQTGADTQKSNQTTLDNALSSFLTDLKAKKSAADDTHANNVAAINAQSATNLQNLYQKMAGFYGSANDTAQANDFMSKATALTPQIANNSKTQTTAYDTTPVAVQAPTLTAFAAPSQASQTITAPTDGQVGSGIFALTKGKKDDSTATPATTPAAASAAGA